MLNPYEIPLDDENVWNMLCNGFTKGVFQVEGRTASGWTKKIKPRNIEELSDIGALARPGCMDVIIDGKSTTQRYCDRKHGLEPIHYEIPILEPILKNTYGLLVFQEQAIEIVKEVGGFNLEQAETLRKAIGKKRADIMSDLEEEFLEGCKKTGKVTEEEAKTIFSWIRESQRYSFNKCFYKDTLIRMADGTEKPIHQLFYENSREKVSSITKGGYQSEAEITDIQYSGKQPCIIIKLETGDKVTVTENHKFWGPFGIVKASKLKPGSIIYNASLINKNLTYDVNPYFSTLVGFCTSHGVFKGQEFVYKTNNQDILIYLESLCLWSGIDSVITGNIIKINFGEYFHLIENCKNNIDQVSLYNDNAIIEFLKGLWIGKKMPRLTTKNLELRFIHSRVGIPTKLTTDGFEIFGYHGYKIFKEKINCTISEDKLEKKMFSYKLPKRLIRQLKVEFTLNHISTSDLMKVSPNNIFRQSNPGNITYKTIYDLRHFDIPLIDQLLNSHIYPVKVVDIIPGPTDHVYDITVEPTHRVIADNVLAMNSHSTAYALIGYWTAYLKYYYPLKFFLHFLTHAKNKIKPKKEIKELCAEAKKMGINIEFPTINNFLEDRQQDFYIKDNKIYFGINNVKGVGEAQIKNIANELDRIGSTTWIDILLKTNINKTCFNNLISVGFFGNNRTEMLFEYNIFSELSDREKEAIRKTNHNSLLEALKYLVELDRKEGGPSTVKRKDIIRDLIKNMENPPSSLKNDPTWVYNIERELLGCSLSFHKTETIDLIADTSCSQLKNTKGICTILIDIESFKEYTIKNGKNKGQLMGSFTGSDDSGEVNCLIFSDSYLENKSKLYEGALVLLKGKFNKDKDNFIVNEVHNA